VAVEPKPEGGKLPSAKPGESLKDVALRYIAENQTIFGLKSPNSELIETKRSKDELGITHLFFQQELNGIPFWGRELTAHLDGSGALTWVNCLLQPTPEGLDIHPSLNAEQAIGIAEDALASEGIAMSLSAEERTRLGLEGPKAELHYWQKNPFGAIDLVWVVEIRPNLQDWMRFFVRAADGEILEQYNATNFDGPATAQATNIAGETVAIHTYQLEGKYRMMDSSRSMFVQGQTVDQLKNDPQGVIWTLDLRGQDLKEGSTIYFILSDDNTWPDPISVSAQNYSEQIYNYYLNSRNRNSFDNQGKTMMALINVAQNGQSMDNAFWNGAFVSLGAGKTVTTHWAGALDFVAHEFTHAHVQYTANLEYKYQSGALNETYADIGGVSLDNEDFLLGEDIAVQQYFPTGAMRDMANPHNGGSGPNDLNTGWQPANMSEYMNLTLEQDNGGVHVNNGITNHAAYNVLNGLGRQKGEQILYRALENYLGKQSNFTDFRLAAVKSAGDLFGEGSDEQNTVKQGFDDVGIVEGSGTTPPEDLPVVPGTQYILVVDEYDLFWGLDNSLKISNGFTDVGEIASTNFLNANFTQVNVASGRPIAADPYGQAIYFVSSSYNLHGASPQNGAEQVISDTGTWWSIAVSPSGRRVAMTRNVDENVIVVLDLQEETSTDLTLLHPTTNQNNDYADVVKYADSLVFLDDTLLVYDCLNSIQSPGEGVLDFWDVNVIDVTNGQILALFPPQSAGVHVVNPIFASTNKSILCVEFFEEGVGSNVVGVNLATGKGSVIVNNPLELAFPCYAPDDHYMLFSRSNVYGFEDVYGIELDGTKTAPVGDPVGLFAYTQLPVWFAVSAPPSAYVDFSAVSSNGAESVTAVSIPVRLSEASTDTVTVDYAVTGGNAIGNGQDYTLDSGRVTFEPSQVEQSIPMIVVDDGVPETDESVTITLSRPVQAWLGDNTVYTYTILDTGGLESTPTPTLPPPPATPTNTPVQPTATVTPQLTPGDTPTPLPEDINKDGHVDQLDQFLLLQRWHQGAKD
jgi:Zn-dependent metalloprotease